MKRKQRRWRQAERRPWAKDLERILERFRVEFARQKPEHTDPGFSRMLETPLEELSREQLILSMGLLTTLLEQLVAVTPRSQLIELFGAESVLAHAGRP